MPNWTKSPDNPKAVAILLFPGFSNHCLANAVEPLRAANNFLGYDYYCWTYVSLQKEPVLSSSGLPVLPEQTLRDHQGGDFLFLVAGYGVQDYATDKTVRELISAKHRFGTIVGMDTGQWLLAYAGLLDQQIATIHPHVRVPFSEAFPDIDVVSDRYVADGPIMTSSGATTTFELVLELIGRSHGEALKFDVAALFLDPRNATGAPREVPQVNDSRLSNAIAFMAENIETPVSIQAVASAASLSQRSLARLFSYELGATPQQVYRRLRLSAAREYARGSHISVSEIALRCGYKDASAMTRAFIREFGVSPSRLRRR